MSNPRRTAGGSTQQGRWTAPRRPVPPPPRPLRVPRPILARTFDQLRRCGEYRNECQVLWVGPWATPDVVTHMVHPRHNAHRGGFVLDNAWLNDFWLELADKKDGIRAQVHTHPRDAFHSETDDNWPIVRLEGFLSLVIPNFAAGPVSFEDSYLAEIDTSGQFIECAPSQRLLVTDASPS